MNFHKFYYIFIILISYYVTTIESANILGVFTSNSKSHLIIHMSVVQELVKRGHNVTVVTTLPIINKQSTYRHIKLENHDYRELIKNLIEANSTMDHLAQLFGNIGTFMDSNDKALKDPKMQQLMQHESFDLLLLGYFVNEFQLGLGAHFKCPIVMIWTGAPFGAINQFVRNPSEIMSVPSIFLRTESKILNFRERFRNFFIWMIEQVGIQIIDYIANAYYIDNFPLDKYPTYAEMKKNISLILCNHHFSEGPIRANVPAIVEIGGIQIKPKPDPLPADINRFLATADKNGAIFFSLGSNVHGTDLNTKTIQILYKVLSNLKQKVLWKWEDDQPPGNASNIFFSKWLPQDDILAHPNIRLFITHGGKGSVVEAKYHGVPMIGIPIFADQPLNVQSFEKAGYGIGLTYQSITEQTFRNAIIEILENQKYRDNIKEFANLYRDRPMTARETAAYWVEYVIRHHGAAHLQSPAVYLEQYEYLGLDIGICLIVILWLCWKITKISLKFICRKLFCRKSTNVNTKNVKTIKHKKQ